MPEVTPRARIAFVDWDDTIARPTWNTEQGRWGIGNLTRGAGEGLDTLAKMGLEVVIFTSRPHGYQRDEVGLYIKEKGLHVDDIHPTVKPQGLVFIDDLASGFRGNWTETIEDVQGIMRRDEERRNRLNGKIKEHDDVFHTDYMSDDE